MFAVRLFPAGAGHFVWRNNTDNSVQQLINMGRALGHHFESAPG